MEAKEFFNSVAWKWDQMCRHDDNKLKKIIEMSLVKEGSKILDVGTGTGVLIGYLLNSSPCEITAIDVSENMITVAEGKYKDSRLRFIVKDIMEFYAKGYDYIFLYSAYPHFQDKDALLYHLSTLMNTRGKLVIAHSESKEKINEIHRSNENVCNDALPSGEVTARIMSKYFKTDKIIDNNEIYYVSGIKE